MTSNAPVRLDHVDTWVFDLDNTLYPHDAPVMSQVEAKMTEFIMRHHGATAEEAGRLRDHYWSSYGTTLNGLMRERKVDRAEFLDFVHDIDHSVLTPDAKLAEHISALDGRRFVYTNGSMRHAERVLDRLGLSDHFHDLFDIEAAEFMPKPEREGFERFGRRFGVIPSASAMFEDSARNLQTAHALGYSTIWLRPAGQSGAGGHIHHEAETLSEFLGGLGAQPTTETTST